MPGMGKEVPMGETYNKYGDAAREVEIVTVGKRGAIVGIPYYEIPEGGSVVEWDLRTQWGYTNFGLSRQKLEPALAKIGN